MTTKAKLDNRKINLRVSQLAQFIEEELNGWGLVVEDGDAIRDRIEYCADWLCAEGEAK